MNAKRNLVNVVSVLVAKIEIARLGEIDLVSRDRELTTDHAPRLHVDLWPVKRSFVWHLDVIDSRVFQNIARHLLGLFPKLRLVDKFLAKLRGIMRREAHQIFIDAEE